MRSTIQSCNKLEFGKVQFSSEFAGRGYRQHYEVRDHASYVCAQILAFFLDTTGCSVLTTVAIHTEPI